MIIETKQLTKTYGKSRGIIDLDLNVKEGDFFGFIGPNGAGKSTTIRILLGLISPTSGNASVFGKSVKEFKNEILTEVGYVPSETAFYEGMKVREIIKLSEKLHKKDCSEEAKKLVELLDLDLDKKIEELSLGNRKKVSIVCALQHRPKLYILDEPTSGLDPLVQKQFFKILHERHKEGATILLSSHVLSDIQQNCSKAAIIKEGKIIAVDTVDKLTKTNAKRITIYGIEELPNIENIKSLEKGIDHISFLYNGDMKKLLLQLVDLPIKDLTITEPSLEEAFIHYYEKEGTI